MILITGGLGFIGLHTARCFLDAGEGVVLTQYRVRREPDFLKDEIGRRVFIEKLDVTSAHDVIDLARRHKIKGIVHLAVPGLAALSQPRITGSTSQVGSTSSRPQDYATCAASASQAQWPSMRVSRRVRSKDAGTGPIRKPYRDIQKVHGDPGIALCVAKRTRDCHARIGTPYGPLYHSLAAPTSRICHAAVKESPLTLKAVEVERRTRTMMSAPST